MASNPQTKISKAERRLVDGARLTEALGIDGNEIDWRKEYTQFSQADTRNLESVSDVFDAIADDLVDDFYDHLQSHNETVAIIDSSSKPVEMLKRDQRQYVMELGQGEYGQSYFNRRARIGKIHDMLDLGPKIYFGAYSIYYRGVLEALGEEAKADIDDPETAETIDTLLERVLSVLKLINLDQQVAMDTYIHSYSQQVEELADQQQTLMKNVEDDLQQPISDLSNSSQDVTDRTAKVSETIHEQTEKIDTVTEETASMSATIEEIASTAATVSQTSEAARERAERGKSSSTEALGAMETIDESVGEVAENMDSLQSQMEAVSEFTTVIDTIADQTNLLALNASIEAANAGEAGSGFAVVANEVKSLAEESKENAIEIEKTIDNARETTSETAESLEKTATEVSDGQQRVEATMDDLEKIVTTIRDASEGIQDVSDATDDQAATTEEVASMVDSMVREMEQMADQMDAITDATETQAAQIRTIADTASRLSDSQGGKSLPTPKQ